LDSVIPVVGTLAGALIGGGVALLTQRMTARYARESQIRNMAEERARWAAEKKLGELKKLYGQVVNFLDATAELRMSQARVVYITEDTKESVGKLKAAYNSARNRWEPGLNELLDDILIFDMEIYETFREVLQPRQEWFFAKTEKEGIKHLLTLEQNLRDFSGQIAERYRQVFLDRKKGTDN
jgi:gas vesicle protein